MLYIVIPVFNRLNYTKGCLLSLRQQTAQSFRTIVVDDGSTDGTAQALADEFPEVTVLHGDGNLFWTAGVNLGIAHALAQPDAQWVMTLNNDTVLRNDFVAQTLRQARLKPRAILGAYEWDYHSQQPFYGGEIIHWPTHRMSSLLDSLPTEQRSGLHRVTHASGRGLLIPKVVFDAIGLFAQQQLPHYMADYDYTLQAAKHGFEVYCNYDAVLFTYSDESGESKIRKQKTLKNYYNHLFSIRGGANLRDFTRFALRNCPPQWLPLYMAQGYARRLVGYFVN